MLLWHHLDIVHIADAGPFIGRTVSDPASPYDGSKLQSLGLYGKTGRVEPDYFCLTNRGEAVIAEAKGAIGSPGALTNDTLHGKKQVKNVALVGLRMRADANRLVLATNLRREDEKPSRGKDSGVAIIDPDPNPDAIQVKILPSELILHSYAKALKFAGLWALAETLVSMRPPTLPPDDFLPPPVNLGAARIIPLGGSPAFFVGITVGVAEALFNEGGPDGLEERVARALEPVAGYELPAGAGLLLPNGVAVGRLIPR